MSIFFFITGWIMYLLIINGSVIVLLVLSGVIGENFFLFLCVLYVWCRFIYSLHTHHYNIYLKLFMF